MIPEALYISTCHLIACVIFQLSAANKHQVDFICPDAEIVVMVVGYSQSFYHHCRIRVIVFGAGFLE